MHKTGKKIQRHTTGKAEDIFDFDANDKALANKKRKAPVRVRLSILEAARATVCLKPTVVVCK